MSAKDLNKERNIQCKLCLTFEKFGLYTRDSILLKGDYYMNLVRQIPFILEYLDENSQRNIDVPFDNGTSLSKKIKTK